MTIPARSDSGDGQGRIIEYPEKYKEIVEKLEKREQEQIEQAFVKHDVTSIEQLKVVVKETLNKKKRRSESKAITDHTIVKDPQSEQVLAVSKRVKQETSQIFKEVIASLPPEYSESLTKKHVPLKEE